MDHDSIDVWGMWGMFNYEFCRLLTWAKCIVICIFFHFENTHWKDRNWIDDSHLASKTSFRWHVNTESVTARLKVTQNHLSHPLSIKPRWQQNLVKDAYSFHVFCRRPSEEKTPKSATKEEEKTLLVELVKIDDPFLGADPGVVIIGKIQRFAQYSFNNSWNTGKHKGTLP